jgi:hypothetical protein
MTKKEKNKRLGDIGENLVAKILNGVLSENEYDMVKDGVLPNGEDFEVKTQNRHPNWKMPYFSIDDIDNNNKSKCLNVENLYFVEYDSTNDIKIWHCTDPRDYITYETYATAYSPSLKKIGWDINKMILIHTEHDPILAEEMRSLSQAKQFKR